MATKPILPVPGTRGEHHRVSVNGGVTSPLIVPVQTTNSAPTPPPPPAPGGKK